MGMSTYPGHVPCRQLGPEWWELAMPIGMSTAVRCMCRILCMGRVHCAVLALVGGWWWWGALTGLVQLTLGVNVCVGMRVQEVLRQKIAEAVKLKTWP
jgi:hypothetical protein